MEITIKEIKQKLNSLKDIGAQIRYLEDLLNEELSEETFNERNAMLADLYEKTGQLERAAGTRSVSSSHAGWRRTLVQKGDAFLKDLKYQKSVEPYRLSGLDDEGRWSIRGRKGNDSLVQAYKYHAPPILKRINELLATWDKLRKEFDSFVGKKWFELPINEMHDVLYAAYERDNEKYVVLEHRLKVAFEKFQMHVINEGDPLMELLREIYYAEPGFMIGEQRKLEEAMGMTKGRRFDDILQLIAKGRTKPSWFRRFWYKLTA